MMRFIKNKRSLFSRALILLSLMVLIPASATGNEFLRMQTDLGAIDIELFDDTPLTRDNFLNYVNDGDYEGTFVHRSLPGFVLQGGGYLFDPAEGGFFTGGTAHIPVDDPVTNEPVRSNVRGTIAMAKLDGDPDSATSEWFFNLADNSANLDNQNGGFTVFAQVLGNGMEEVVDAIVALEKRCSSVLSEVICGQTFKDTPFVETVAAEPASRTLVKINYIGEDIDGDGVIDKQEDAAPNSGDGNDDGIADSDQQNVASFLWSTGDYIVMKSPSDSPLQSLNIVGETFALAYLPTPGIIDEQDFFYGYAGFDLPAPTNGDPVAVTITLPAGDKANKYFNFGPTSGDPNPHWYDFTYDGQTGAVFEDNVVTLYFVDGERGDAITGVTNGSITTFGGPAINEDLDHDGVLNDIEDGAPNNGDGNNDGMPDSLQAHVSSLMDLWGNYITVAADSASLKLASLDAGFGLEFLLRTDTPEILNGRNFPHGFVTFVVTGLLPGAGVEVKVILPEGESPVSYLKYGPTPDMPFNHLYEFIYDNQTGAEFDGNTIILHLIDGERGDADLLADGVIFDPGAPAVTATAIDSGGGSSGCSLRRPGSGPSQGGAWWLLLAMLGLYSVRKL